VSVTGLDQLRALLDVALVSAERVRGGDICDTWRCTLENGQVWACKTMQDPPAGFFEAEARGLRFLAGAGLKVPRVEHVGVDSLALEWVASVRGGPEFEERLGRTLARAHRFSEEQVGLEEDNFLAGLPQPNPRGRDWPTFFRDARIAHALEIAMARGRLSPGTESAVLRAMDRVEQVLEVAEPLVRLHGDLWRGNVLCTPTQDPVFIDPAAYCGHREVDLAMLDLFGGWTPRCHAAYEQSYPLAPGWRRRRQVYQLYPLLVHAALFGGGYEGQVSRLARGLCGE